MKETKMKRKGKASSRKKLQMICAVFIALSLVLTNTTAIFALEDSATNDSEVKAEETVNADDSTKAESDDQETAKPAEETAKKSTLLKSGKAGESKVTSDIDITNLAVSPSTVSNNKANIEVSFKYTVAITGTEQTYYKDGDTVEIPSNLGELFDFKTGATSITSKIYDANTGDELGTTVVYSDKTVITWNANAEAQRITDYMGTISTGRQMVAKKLQTTATDLTKVLNMGDASTNVTWPGLIYKLLVSYSGQGSATANGNTVWGGSEYACDLNATDPAVVVATPNTGCKILSATLVKSDGTEVPLTITNPDSDSPQTFNVNKSDIMLGDNYLKIEFTSDAAGFDYSQAWKECWLGDGAEGGFQHASRHVIKLNGMAVGSLYGNKGAGINSEYLVKNLIFEDEIDGGLEGIPANLQIKAIMPNYSLIDGNYAPLRPGESGVNLISAGYMNLITQNAGESYSEFKARISATTYNYGIYVDSKTNISTIVANLGSPGDPDSYGVKCSDIYASRLAADADLNTINGDNNCVNGKVQYFAIDYRVNHDNVKSERTFTNTGVASYSSNSTEVTVNTNTTAWKVSVGTADAAGVAGMLKIHKYDATSGDSLQGAKFKLEKKDTAGNWVDYANTGSTVSGTTDADGILDLGICTVGTYRIVETEAPAGYSKDTAVYGAQSTSQGTISAKGEFTVKADDAKGFVASVTNSKVYNVQYVANGGTGTLVDPQSPYAEGATWNVLSAGSDIVRAGYKFAGWNSKADGTGTVYTVGSSHTMGQEDVTLYAQWKEKNSKEIESPTIVKDFTTDSDALPATPETFTFTCKADSGNPATPENFDVDNLEVTGAGEMVAAMGKNIGFKKAGTYKFSLTENAGTEAGYTYDDTEHVWEVVVAETASGYEITSNKIDGEDVTGAGSITFTNEYHYGSVKVESPTLTKKITGDTPTTATNFSFACEADANNPTGGVKNIDSEATITGAGTKNAAFGDEVEFVKEGTYNFTISETAGTDTEYTYATTKYKWEVVVTKGTTDYTITSNTLSDESGDVDAAVFENKYTAPSADYTVPTVTKTTSGQPIPESTKAAGPTFEYTITADDSAYPMPEDTTITTKGAGTATFGNITFKKTGTYIHTIAETKGTEKGWKYDESKYKLTVTVSENNSKLVATGQVTKEGEAADAITFDNNYEPEAVTTADPPVSKIVSGDKPIVDGNFQFKMLGKDGAPMPKDATGDTVVRDLVGPGAVEMGEMTYTEAGVYEYEISEVAGVNNNYEYDSTVYKMTVTVTDNDGTLKATRAFTDGTTVAEKMEFNNKFVSGKDVTITKTADKESVKPGDIITYTITATNTGNSDVVGFWLRDTVPENTTFVSCDKSGSVSANKKAINWFIPLLSPGKDNGEAFTLKVRVNDDVTGKTEIRNTAMFEITGEPDVPDYNKDKPKGQPTPTAKTTVKATNNNGNGKAKSTKTGDEYPIIAILALIASAGALGGALYRKKR